MSTQAPDDFLIQVFSEIEKTLTTPPDAYGVEFTDVLDLPHMPATKKDGYHREGSSLYVSGERVQWRNLKYENERFETNPDFPVPYLVNIGVYTGLDHPYRTRSILRGIPTLGEESRSSFSVGIADIYNFSTAPAINRERPDKSPYQILANPCFAPLNLPLDVLRKWKIQTIQEQDRSRVYEAVGVHPSHPGKRASLTMYFSPANGNALSRTEMAITGSDGKAMRETRAVEKWQKLNEGILVPQTFSYVQEVNGNVQLRLVRTVTAAAMNEVSEDRFNIEKIPEFQSTFDKVK